MTFNSDACRQVKSTPSKNHLHEFATTYLYTLLNLLLTFISTFSTWHLTKLLKARGRGIFTIIRVLRLRFNLHWWGKAEGGTRVQGNLNRITYCTSLHFKNFNIWINTLWNNKTKSFIAFLLCCRHNTAQRDMLKCECLYRVIYIVWNNHF